MSDPSKRLLANDVPEIAEAAWPVLTRWRGDNIRALRHFGIANVDLFERLLLHKRARVQVAAFIALRTFAPDRAVSWALANLDRQELKVRKVSVRFLAKRGEPEVLERARACYTAALGDVQKSDVRVSIVHLFSRIGGWPVLADYCRQALMKNLVFDTDTSLG